MKKLVLLPLVAAMSCFIFLSCNKEIHSSNITLYDKPISVVQSYIQGKWRVHYYYGGFVANLYQDRESFNEYFEFKNNNKVTFFFENSLVADTNYKFISYQQNSADYIHNIIKFYLQTGAPYTFETNKIKNDTLILAVPSINNPDFFSIFLTKVN